MKLALRIVIIEDSPDDTLLVVREVEHAGYAVQAQRVQTAEELRATLAQGTWDLVLADDRMPHFSATEGLAILKETRLDVPFIIVSGCIGEDVVVQLMKDGATDYVRKDHLSRLGPAVKRELRDAKRSLAESEERYRLLVESQTDLIVKTDPEGRFLYANPTYCALFGKSLPELTGSSYQPLIHPDDLSTVADATAGLFHPPYSCRYEARAMTVDGWRWIEWVTRAELDSQDTIVALLGSGRDITDRKQAEEESQRERAFFDQLVETAPEGIAIADTQGRIMRVNAEFVRMFGYGVDEVVGQYLDDLVAPPALQEEAEALTRSTIQGGKNLLETVRRRKDGTLVDVSLIGASILVAGKLEAVYAIYRDITERKQAEETLHNERLLLRTLIDNIPDSIYSKDLACRKTLANSTEVRYIGAESEAGVLGKSDFDIYPGELAEKFFADDQLVLQTGEPVLNREEYVFDEKQQKRWLLTSKLPLQNQEGRIIGLVGIGRDITDRKQAEEAREQTEAQLRQSQKMEAIGTLAGGVAHDFNNLLTGILGNIALMRSTLPSADPLLENLDGVETCARQAANLTKGLLTFSRKAVVSAVSLDMAEAVDTTLAILKQSLPATMDIVRDDEQPAWNVLLDQSQLTQILLNLAVNARDAMKDKGTLTIRTRNVTIDTAYVHEHFYARTGEFIHLSVRDIGPGMSSEVMQHLFEPFYTTKPIGSGTGLGLSVVYGAVKQAGGWITAVSTEGVGTTFDIYLPRCLEEPMQSFTPSPLPVNAGSGTVLLVEDEPIVRAVAQALLSRSGYTVLTAPDGASALNVLRDHSVGIGLILLDMTMPGMTTGEVVQAIRALDPTVPILLNSGYTSNGVVKQMLAEDSVQGFLPKPYKLQELLSTIDQLMKRT